MKPFSFKERSAIFSFLGERFTYVSRYESNGYSDNYGRYEWILAASNSHILLQQEVNSSVWKDLEFHSQHLSNAPIHPCFLSYDLKNASENLSSSNTDGTEFPAICLWSPEQLIALDRQGNLVYFGSYTIETWKRAASSPERGTNNNKALKTRSSVNFEQYNQTFDKLISHILRGDIYEVNYCRRESGTAVNLDPQVVFDKLNALSPAPFACLHKVGNSWLICSSPERFLTKHDKLLVSQPIKGTVRRSGILKDDVAAMDQLRENKKERAENIMIVDLVRNDLSHFAEKGSVIVEELCGIYPFATVSHMISTVLATLKDKNKSVQALEKAFPMGSMTGAPKIRAMQLIEEAEDFKRGIYSGACGYFCPSGDFDFNVVIRSIVWNASSGFLSFATGSAVTAAANGTFEYNECMLKAEAMKSVLTS
jgi:para-aminobenzoate synthetase component I